MNQLDILTGRVILAHTLAEAYVAPHSHGALGFSCNGVNLTRCMQFLFVVRNNLAVRTRNYNAV